MKWETVRVLGSMSLLTRASFAGLLAVPIVVSIWAPLSVFLSSSAVKLRNTIDQFAVAAQNFELGSRSLGVGNEAMCFLDQALLDEVETFRETLTAVTVDSATIPLSLALTFFASLSAVLGQALYQALAPALVKKMSAAEYANNQVSLYKDTTNQALLDAARRVLEERPGGFREQESISSKMDVEIISEAAYIQYREEARRSLSSFFSGGFYFVAIILVLTVLVIQCVNIISATKWI